MKYVLRYTIIGKIYKAVKVFKNINSISCSLKKKYMKNTTSEVLHSKTAHRLVYKTFVSCQGLNKFFSLKQNLKKNRLT